MEYAAIIISVVGSVVAIAVSWGRNAAQAEESQRWRSAMEKKIEETTSKQLCDLKHGFLDQTMHRIELSVEELKELIKELSKEMSGK